MLIFWEKKGNRIKGIQVNIIVDLWLILTAKSTFFLISFCVFFNFVGQFSILLWLKILIFSVYLGAISCNSVWIRFSSFISHENFSTLFEHIKFSIPNHMSSKKLVELMNGKKIKNWNCEKDRLESDLTKLIN